MLLKQLNHTWGLLHDAAFQNNSWLAFARGELVHETMSSGAAPEQVPRFIYTAAFKVNYAGFVHSSQTSVDMATGQ